MISLRSFVILSSLIVVVLALFFSWMQMKEVWERGASTLENKELEHISQLVRSGIEIKKTELRNYTRIVRSNNDLSSTYIIGKESGDTALIDAKLRAIQNDLPFDFSEIIDPDGKSIHSSSEIRTVAIAQIIREREGLFLTDLRGEPALISFSPLMLYGEPIAIVALGYFLRGRISKDLSLLTSADIAFAHSPPSDGTKTKLGTAPHSHLSFRVDKMHDGELWARITLKDNPAQSFWAPLSTKLIYSGIVSLVLLLIALFCFLEFGFIRGFRTFVEEVKKVSQDVGRGEPREIPVSTSHIHENKILFMACSDLVKKLIAYHERIKEQVLLQEAVNKQKALGDLAQQVSHDIRSPLSALLIAINTLVRIPEEHRLVIRQAVCRIQDIANSLLANRKKIEMGDPTLSISNAMESDAVSVQLLSCLIESIVSEKRIQLRDRLDIRIETKLDPSCYGLFANVQPTTFKTVISNLIDNSVEAMEKAGNIFIHLRDQNEGIEVSIEDNGKGIASEVLPVLSQRGRSYKEHGSGLGLFHARTNVENWYGKLQIRSTLGVGTEVTLALPKANPPKWFVPSIDVHDGEIIVVIDDDVSIHHIWEKRFFPSSSIEKGGLLHFSTPEQIRQWKNNFAGGDALYLVDFEYLGKSENGLSLIESLGIESQSILVTSRHDDPAVIDRCEKGNIRLLPKAMAGFVPIRAIKGTSVSRASPLIEMAEGVSRAV